jgi:hypothetical protein
MERVAFLLEATGERLGCMLNPARVIVRRRAGVRARESSSGPLTGAGLKDDPLLYTGGGTTEIILDLLFDVTLPGSSVVSEDVRDLTRPLMELAEGTPDEEGRTKLPVVRFVWGKQWNIPGVVAAIAERLEYFTPEGAPQRSWLRMRLVRVSEQPERLGPRPQGPVPRLKEDAVIAADEVRVHEVIGGGAGAAAETEPVEQEPSGSTERLDEIAHRLYGDARSWRIIAAFNDVANPLELGAGRLLRIPPRSAISGGAE